MDRSTRTVMLERMLLVSYHVHECDRTQLRIAGIPGSLATLHARLRALETENSVSRRRVRELEAELERAKDEVETAKTGSQGRLREVIGEKTGKLSNP
jgi:predicted  nucleic acid-binding Zn-ribbon protein